ncbi:bud site selection protein, putative [Candida dubliniensis CD36]|uniref:Bud site selection protein, putative n=1 Tax=Candida dubliniensis (strain CD36 / ATCC MYA-646 / CBS 7987 / NCPF 3949 / NRRL Y-17841) TaxID=573826 RepID=B9WCG3_CANDC|nr:bud site selection protein, putative [Candida dubliniensis CD36]CAX44085.1 bud site selection protein, putative [Candida dubliniensis CD36]
MLSRNIFLFPNHGMFCLIDTLNTVKPFFFFFFFFAELIIEKNLTIKGFTCIIRFMLKNLDGHRKVKGLGSGSGRSVGRPANTSNQNQNQNQNENENEKKKKKKKRTYTRFRLASPHLTSPHLNLSVMLVYCTANYNTK